MQRPGWIRSSSKPLLHHSRIPAREDIVRLDDGSEAQYAMLELPDAVTAVIKRGDSKYLLNLEYAYPVDDRIHRPNSVISDGWLYKFPGGMLRPGETYEQAAMRKVKEETGSIIGRIGLLAPVRNYFPRSNSIDYKLFAEIVGSGAKDREAEEANMQQHWLTGEEIDQLITNQDPRVMFSHFLDTWHLYRGYRNR